jgi:hypothetical protein
MSERFKGQQLTALPSGDRIWFLNRFKDEIAVGRHFVVVLYDMRPPVR